MKKEQLVALIFAALVAASATGFSSRAEQLNYQYDIGESTYHKEFSLEHTAKGSFVRNYKQLGKIPTKDIYSYKRPSVKIGSSELYIKGLIINGSYYIPFRAAAAAIGASYSYNKGAASSTMVAKGLVLQATNGCYTSYANDRVLFCENPTVIMSDGRMYIPAEIFAKAVGMKLKTSFEGIVLSGSYSPLADASSYYREDQVFWLARIIHAESRGEPLYGKIAVGNVVLNRVYSPLYPSTIYGVIFDRKYGVQFSPVLDGSIYCTPDYNSILAAKICLEGYNITDEALFFLEPKSSTSNWIPNNRRYAFTVGNHDFYY